MENEIKEHIEYMIAIHKKTTIDGPTLKFDLITKFNIKSLMYPHVARQWLEQYFLIITRLGLGKYDKGTQSLVLNENNEFVSTMMAKYHVA